MALKLKEITATAKATLNLGDYSNVVYEITLTADVIGESTTDDIAPHIEALELQVLAREALTIEVAAAVQSRLIAGIPALNGKVGATRRAALESQPCTKVLATLNPELAKEVIDRVLEMSLAPEKKETPAETKAEFNPTRKVPFQTTPKKSRKQWTNADNHPMNYFGDGHPDDYGDN